MSDHYDAERHWRFSCTGEFGCGYSSHGDKPVSACPSCGLDGWNLMNAGPIVVSNGIMWPSGPRHILGKVEGDKS